MVSRLPAALVGQVSLSTGRRARAAPYLARAHPARLTDRCRRFQQALIFTETLGY